jgi:predicted nucleotidyltransferase
LLNETEKEQILRRLQEMLQANSAVVFAFVHGSFLKEGPFHDIDVAVFLDDTLEDPLDTLLELWDEVASQVEYPLDLRLLNEAPLAFRYNVTRGRLIFARDEEEALRFIERAWDEFFDFQPILEAYTRDLIHD